MTFEEELSIAGAIGLLNGYLNILERANSNGNYDELATVTEKVATELEKIISEKEEIVTSSDETVSL